MLNQENVKQITANISGYATMTATMEKILVALEQDQSLPSEAKVQMLRFVKGLGLKAFKLWVFQALTGGSEGSDDEGSGQKPEHQWIKHIVRVVKELDLGPDDFL
ncbi:MAG: hypothetical protein HPY59_07700 [Anaerolineae bacterium]|nr:hypothetical protein [Anaerolineae bacterium]